MSRESRPVWCDGGFVPAAARTISPRDPGFLLGLAAFETMLFEEGCLYFVEEHLARLAGSARGLGIEWPPRWDLREALDEYCRRLSPQAPSGLRLTLTPGAPGAGPSVVIDSRTPPVPDARGVEVLPLERQRLAGSPLAALKSTSRIAHHLARRRAEAEGAWEALLGTDEGDFAEGSSSNLFVVRGGRALTPSIDRGCLPGIVRDKLLHEISGPELPVGEGRISPEDLRAADEVFLTSSLARILPVRGVRGIRRDLPGAQGPAVRRLSERFLALEERYRAGSPR